jgi:hypothetical protein
MQIANFGESLQVAAETKDKRDRKGTGRYEKLLEQRKKTKALRLRRGPKFLEKRK